MIYYKTKQVNKQVPEYIICDKCKKRYDYQTTADEFEIQEFFFIRDVGGYFSIWGDGENIEYDICQHCFKEFVDSFKDKEDR